MDRPGNSFLLAFGSLGKGFILLYFSLFTLTMSHRTPSCLRFALAPWAIYYFWNFGWSYEAPFRTWATGMTTIGLYGIMRTLEHSVVTLWDPNPPRWVARDETRTVLPLPNTFRARCAYAADLLTSLRGSSWFAGFEWNWIPSAIHSWRPPPSRRRFIAQKVRTYIIHYILLDLSDILNKSRVWETGGSNPVTSLPVSQQLVFSISVCAGTALSISLGYTSISCVFVICGSSPDSWPPIFDSPFLAKSLKDFWSRRWHLMFRRVFERLSLPFTSLPLLRLDGNGLHSERIVAIARLALTFAYSTLLHLVIMHRVALREFYRSGRTNRPPFFDVSVVGFFLSQPLGIVVESTLVVPFANWMFPACPRSPNVTSPSLAQNGHAEGSQKFRTPGRDDHGRLRSRWERDAMTRLYAWMFLLWTGRWWADKWGAVGLWNDGEGVVPFSVVRFMLETVNPVQQMMLNKL